MSKKKKDKGPSELDEMLNRVDRKYEDIPPDKDDPVIKASSEIQKAHTMGLLGIVFGIVLPVLGLLLGIVGFLKTKALTDVPYDLRRRYSSSKSLCKAAIAVSMLMIFLLVAFISAGGLSLINK